MFCRNSPLWRSGESVSRFIKIHTFRFNPFFTSSIFPTLRLPYVWYVYTHGTFATDGFRGESLGWRHGDIELRTTHVDYFLGPPFGDPKSLVKRGTDVYEVSWDIHLCHICHKVVTLLRAVTFGVVLLWLLTPPCLCDRNLGRPSHSKLLGWWLRGGVVCQNWYGHVLIRLLVV